MLNPSAAAISSPQSLLQPPMKPLHEAIALQMICGGHDVPDTMSVAQALPKLLQRTVLPGLLSLYPVRQNAPPNER